tara:strand:- start:65346 stop:65759 length:414 start_codon:yes stop_codon:yes gene_type:complete
MRGKQSAQSTHPQIRHGGGGVGLTLLVGDIVRYDVNGSLEMGMIVDRHVNHAYEYETDHGFRRMQNLVLVHWFPSPPGSNRQRPQMYANPELKGDCWVPADSSIGWIPVWLERGIPTFELVSSVGSASGEVERAQVA